ncbi:cell wall integrity and stress response component 2-like isoform X2 [Lingula anatina]|nr:cell wall integrity and stress response component 2-like isoform X2 [Lingula anatina]|eukprot:XP_013401915.1 cell wall integrity and stress response component 2-like isoform X2 [Lingula anatina]
MPYSTYYTTGSALRVYLVKTYSSSTGYSFEFSVWRHTGTSTTLGTLSLPISMDDSTQCGSQIKYVNSGQYLWVNAWAPSNTYRTSTSSCTMYFRAAISTDYLAVSFASGSLSISSSYVTLYFYDGSSTSSTLLTSFNSYTSSPSSTYYATGSSLTVYLSNGYSSSISFSFQVFATSTPVTTTATPSSSNTNYRYMDDSTDDCSDTIYMSDGQTEIVSAASGSSMSYSSSSYCYLYFRTRDSSATMKVNVTQLSLYSYGTLKFYDSRYTSSSLLKEYSYSDYIGSSADTFYTSGQYLSVRLYRSSSSSHRFTFKVSVVPPGLSSGAIAGIVLGSLAAVVVLLVIVIKVCSSSKKSSPRTRIRPHNTRNLTTTASTVNYTTTSGQMGMQTQPYGGFASQGPAYPPPSQAYGPTTSMDSAYPPPSQAYGPVTSLDPAYPPPSQHFSAPPPSYTDATGGDGLYAPPPPPPSYCSTLNQTDSAYKPGFS